MYVAGESAFSHDFLKELNDWLPWVIVWIVVSSLVVFALMLRSVVLPVLAVVVNLLTIAMSFGWLVILFQGDTFEKILRFTSTGAVDAINRVLMLCILFGITMDYAVFMLTRMHERWHRTGDNRESVSVRPGAVGTDHRQRRLLVVIVTGAFAFTSIATTKTLGLGIALGDHRGHAARTADAGAGRHGLPGQVQLVVAQAGGRSASGKQPRREAAPRRSSPRPLRWPLRGVRRLAR